MAVAESQALLPLATAEGCLAVLLRRKVRTNMQQLLGQTQLFDMLIKWSTLRKAQKIVCLASTGVAPTTNGSSSAMETVDGRRVRGAAQPVRILDAVEEALFLDPFLYATAGLSLADHPRFKQTTSTPSPIGQTRPGIKLVSRSPRRLRKKHRARLESTAARNHMSRAGCRFATGVEPGPSRIHAVEHTRA
ncbi:hypothetical protein DE146DRAFT_655607 [Phaeosphaeria sp. MPI-PUGE-AT-0046c]|nr:hypothetical protein DE146DRAFT_655607 [Phaeosphaeria sp. MPI-PUGE-AT-0046c]